MTPKKPGDSHPEKPLTETELEMMNVIWRIGPCTVAQILEALPPERPLAYTSVSTIVRILEQKGYVTAEKAGRGHLYSSAVAKNDYQQKSITYMLENIFDGTPASLVRQLLQNKSLKQSDVSEIRRMLEKKD